MGVGEKEREGVCAGQRIVFTADKALAQVQHPPNQRLCLAAFFNQCTYYKADNCPESSLIRNL